MGSKLALFGFELGLFFPPHQVSNYSYLLVIKELIFICLFRKLALFCKKRPICRGSSTVVEGKLVKSELKCLK